MHHICQDLSLDQWVEVYTTWVGKTSQTDSTAPSTPPASSFQLCVKQSPRQNMRDVFTMHSWGWDSETYWKLWDIHSQSKGLHCNLIICVQWDWPTTSWLHGSPSPLICVSIGSETASPRSSSKSIGDHVRPGKDNLADFFTKPLPIHKHQEIVDKLIRRNKVCNAVTSRNFQRSYNHWVKRMPSEDYYIS